MKPVLFIEADGPLLIPTKLDEPSILPDAVVAPYAKTFLHWAKEHFDVRCLTDRHPVDMVRVLDKLSLPGDAVSVVPYGDSKIPLVALHKNQFYWVDSQLIPSEVSWLAEHGPSARWFFFDPRSGVRPEHKQLLEQKIRR
jgi:hypothetical protein